MNLNGALDQAHQDQLVERLSSHQADIEQAAKHRLSGEVDSIAPHQLLMAEVEQDGDGWRASYSSVSALGKTPREAPGRRMRRKKRPRSPKPCPEGCGLQKHHGIECEPAAELKQIAALEKKTDRIKARKAWRERWSNSKPDPCPDGCGLRRHLGIECQGAAELAEIRRLSSREERVEARKAWRKRWSEAREAS